MSIKVYKASAGSGKTYTLVYEYIKFLFNAQSLMTSALKQGGDFSMYYSSMNLHRGILAVTFTNKSTAEMKERIVMALYELAKGGREDYVKKLRGDSPALSGVDDAEIGRRAKALLTDILQDYTQFRVSTIDGFFQQVVRSFARELNLNNQYQVELDTDRILEMAVDNMLASLGNSQQSTADGQQSTLLLDWLTEFASENVVDGKSWNPRSAILGLAKAAPMRRGPASTSLSWPRAPLSCNSRVKPLVMPRAMMAGGIAPMTMPSSTPLKRWRMRPATEAASVPGAVRKA